MDPRNLLAGEVMQINPESDDRFGGCLMVVTEPKSWGARGYCPMPGSDGVAYYRCIFADMEPTGGQAEWIIE